MTNVHSWDHSQQNLKHGGLNMSEHEDVNDKSAKSWKHAIRCAAATKSQVMNPENGGAMPGNLKLKRQPPPGPCITCRRKHVSSQYETVATSYFVCCVLPIICVNMQVCHTVCTDFRCTKDMFEHDGQAPWR